MEQKKKADPHRVFPTFFFYISASENASEAISVASYTLVSINYILNHCMIKAWLIIYTCLFFFFVEMLSYAVPVPDPDTLLLLGLISPSRFV